ncbi:MAG: trigger factor [Chloroflexi bacterium]|nr:trigger factor [Chloroflexota bacterium]
MKVTTEPTEGREVLLHIAIDSGEMDKAMKAAARRISQKANVPGFRKGKAPYHMVISMFGKEAVQEEALDALAPTLYEQALNETEIEPFAAGVLEEVSESDPPVLRMRVPLPPTVELGDYRSIQVDWQEPTVPDDKVEETLQSIADKYGSWEAKDGVVAEGDLVKLNLEGHTEDGQEVFNAQGRSLVVRLGSAYPLPGFHEELLGMAVGEAKTFTLTFPEDSGDKERAGKPVTCEAEVTEVSVRQTPAIDDDLAKLEGDYETLDALRAEVQQRLLAQAQEEAEGEYRHKVMEALQAQSKVQFPPAAVEQELDSMLRSQEQRLKEQGFSLAIYLGMMKTTLESYRNGLKPGAEQRLVERLLLEKLGDVEQVQAKDEEIDALVQGMLSSAGEGDENQRMRSLMASPDGRQLANAMLRPGATMEFLVRVAKGEDAPPAAATPAQEQQAEGEQA